MGGLSHSRTASKELRDLLNAKAAEAYQQGNPWVYLRVNDPVSKYIPAPLIARYTGMRYIWNAPKNRCVLANGSRYYEFSLFSNQVKVGKGEADILTISSSPKIKTVLHIPEDFAISEFACEAIYLEGSQYGIMVTKEMKESAKTLLAALEEGGV